MFLFGNCHKIWKTIVNAQQKRQAPEGACMLGMAEGTSTIVISSVVQDQDGRTFEYTKSCYPVPRNRFIIKINS